MSQADLFQPQSALPEGFAYQPELISREEEADLVARFAELPFKPYAFRGYLGKRKVVWFDETPDFLRPLRARAIAFAGRAPDEFPYTLVTEYEPGAPIGWHRDRPRYGDVVGVSFLSPCVLRLRRRYGEGWERASQRLEPRSVYLLRGPSRTEWEHSIAAGSDLRFSVTFRSLEPLPAGER